MPHSGNLVNYHLESLNDAPIVKKVNEPPTESISSLENPLEQFF